MIMTVCIYGYNLTLGQLLLTVCTGKKNYNNSLNRLQTQSAHWVPCSGVCMQRIRCEIKLVMVPRWRLCPRTASGKMIPNLPK